VQIPKLQKRLVSWLYFFVLLGSMLVKDERKMLMKFPPEVFDIRQSPYRCRCLSLDLASKVVDSVDSCNSGSQ